MPADDLLLRAESRTIRVLEEVARVLERELLLLVGRLDSERGTVRATRDNLASVSQIREQVAAVARREGVPHVLAVLQQELPAIVEEALRDHPGLGEFAPGVVGDLERFFRGQADDIAAGLADTVADDLAAAVRRGVTSGLDFSGLQESIAQALDTSMGRVATLIDRGVRDFHEYSIKRLGQAAGDALGESVLYLYVGPSDGKVRPYCEARLGKALTQTAADDLDPQERFNCRHSLAPMTLDEVRARGVEVFGA